MPKPNAKPPLKKTPLGVFSTSFGAGNHGPANERRICWSAHDLGDGRVEVQPLNSRMIPIGQPRILSREKFEAGFAPEQGYFVSSAAKPQPQKPMGRYEARMALRPPPPPRPRSTVKDMAGLRDEGRRELQHGAVDKALAAYRRILDYSGPLEPDDKHLFNDCGIDLRKAGRHDDALAFYLKAMSAEETDEHLYHNAARALYEKGDVSEARKYLRLSLVINPGLTHSRRFLDWLDKRFPAPAAG